MKYFNASEKQQLFDVIYQQKGKHTKRNIAIFEITKYCALRVSEVCTLKLNFYDRSKATIFCKRKKGSKSNTLKIVDPIVLKALNDYLDERAFICTHSPYLFLSQKGGHISRQRLDALMRFYCQKATYIPPDKWHMHVLRHSRAIELIELGFDVDDVQYWLGHKNSQNTFKYLDYTTVLQKELFRKLELIEGNQNYSERFYL